MVIKFDQVINDIKIADYNNRKIVLSTQNGEPVRLPDSQNVYALRHFWIYPRDWEQEVEC